VGETKVEALSRAGKAGVSGALPGAEGVSAHTFTVAGETAQPAARHMSTAAEHRAFSGCVSSQDRICSVTSGTGQIEPM